MRMAGSSAEMRRTISLFRGSPGTMAKRPWARPIRAPPSISNRSLVFRLAESGPWQAKHRKTKLRFDIEPQFGLPVGRIGPVAGEAPVREDGTDIAIEFNFLAGGRGGKKPTAEAQPGDRLPTRRCHLRSGAQAFRLIISPVSMATSQREP